MMTPESLSREGSPAPQVSFSVMLQWCYRGVVLQEVVVSSPEQVGGAGLGGLGGLGGAGGGAVKLSSTVQLAGQPLQLAGGQQLVTLGPASPGYPNIQGKVSVTILTNSCGPSNKNRKILLFKLLGLRNINILF